MTAEEKRFFEELSAAKTRLPFVPFAIVLRSGKRYEVTDRLSFGFGGELNPRIAVVPEGGPHEFFRFCDVAAIEIHEPAA